MKTKRFIAAAAAGWMLLGSSGAEGIMDLSERYYLNGTGEAIIDDVVFPDEALPDDNNRVFYEIFVGSFSDSDGDGIGDLRGIINRMDYLNDGDPASGLSLGVEGLWLTPIFQSPSYHKYDVTDYYTIDPAFGTMDDLRELVSLCHERGVKVILDLPINHTGTGHRWFRYFKFAQTVNDERHDYYDFYVWAPDGETPAGRSFSRLTGTGVSYESNFASSMPELNFDNAYVREAVLDVAKFYLDLGVDGFRFDAAKYIYYGDTESSVAFWQWYTDELRAIRPDVYLVAEVWDSDGVTGKYAVCMDCFDFTVSQAGGLIAETSKAGNVDRYSAYVEKYIGGITAAREGAMYIPFVANHDTDRASGFLTVAGGQMKVAANLYILGPGSPFIYYGEEIGLRGSRGGANTDANRRLAMRWGDGDTVRDPVGTTYDPAKQTESTVKSLKGYGESLYSHYKRLIMLRKANPEIARGTYTAVQIPESKLGGYIAEWNGKKVMVIHNTTLRTIELDLTEVAGGEGFTTLHAFIGVGEAALDGTLLRIEGQTSVILR